jgi:hypothetical protein
MSENLSYHHNINIPVKFIEFEKPSDVFEERICNPDLVNDEFKDWLGTLGIEIARCIFFSSPPGKKYNLHVDGDKSQDGRYNCAKINIIFNSSNTYMNWYKAKPGFENGTTYLNTLGTPVRYWKKEDCEVLHRTEANRNCVINGSVIHDLENDKNNNGNRVCYSLILRDRTTKAWLRWDELLSILKDYIV